MTLPQAIVQFMGVFFLLGVIWKLLSKAKLLPFALYLIGVNNVYPVWVAEHQLAYYGIMALCLLYPITYWLLRYRHAFVTAPGTYPAPSARVTGLWAGAPPSV